MRKKVIRKGSKGKQTTSQSSKVVTSQSGKVVTSQSGKVVTSQSNQIVKNKGGRPTKYSMEVYKTLDIYLKNKSEAGELPTVTGFAIALGINEDTLYEWAKHHTRLSETLKDIMTLQKDFLLQNSLNGTKKEATSIFLLKANHGMMETSRQEITGKDGKDLNINITAFTGGNVIKQLPTIDGEIVE